jgi:hypothetical protein
MTTPKTRTFEDLLVWQKAMNLVESIYRECRNGSLAKDLSDQAAEISRMLKGLMQSLKQGKG